MSRIELLVPTIGHTNETGLSNHVTHVTHLGETFGFNCQWSIQPCALLNKSAALYISRRMRGAVLFLPFKCSKINSRIRCSLINRWAPRKTNGSYPSVSIFRTSILSRRYLSAKSSNDIIWTWTWLFFVAPDMSRLQTSFPALHFLNKPGPVRLVSMVGEINDVFHHLADSYSLTAIPWISTFVSLLFLIFIHCWTPLSTSTVPGWGSKAWIFSASFACLRRGSGSSAQSLHEPHG